jgi:peptidoglycan hydrolase CwlO-like protein
LIKSRAKAEEDLQEVNKGWDSTKKTVNEQLARINQLGDELTERQLKIKQLTDEKDLLVKGKAKME